MWGPNSPTPPERDGWGVERDWANLGSWCVFYAGEVEGEVKGEVLKALRVGKG